MFLLSICISSLKYAYSSPWLIFFPVLSRNKWHKLPFKSCTMIVWFTYAVKWLSQWVQLTFIFSYRYNKKKRKRKVHFPLMIGTLRTYSLNNFPMCHTSLLIIVTMLYITYLVLVFLITGIFYLLTNFTPHHAGKAHICLVWHCPWSKKKDAEKSHKNCQTYT